MNDPLDFAPDHDVPIPYMQRTREWYLAPEELARLRAENEQAKAIARDTRRQTIAPQREQVAATRTVHR